MRNAIPTRWIEQAESRRILTVVLSERMPPPPRRGVAENVASHLSARLLSWLGARHPMSWAVSPTQTH